MRKLYGFVVAAVCLCLGVVAASCQQPGVVGESPYGMPTVITPDVPPSIATSWEVPTDGETANSLSLQLFTQPLVNATTALKQLTYGGGLRRRVTCTSNTNLVIEALGAVMVETAAGDIVVYQNLSTNPAESPVALTGGLVANTRYYVYAFDNAGSLDFVASTTAPDTGLRYEVGNFERFFVTTFYTNTAGDVLTYSQDDNRYVYTVRTPNGAGAGGNLFLDQGHATGFTVVSLGNSVPSAASQVMYRVLYVVTAADRVGSFGRANTQADLDLVLCPTYPATSFAAGQVEVSGTTGVGYILDNASDFAYMWVVGFTY